MVWIVTITTLLILLLLNGYLVRRSDRKRGWKVEHDGRDDLKYFELIDGSWVSIPINGEMLTTKRPFHVIYFESKEKWVSYPEWARDNRTQIIARIKSTFKPPQYEYEGE